MPSREQLIQQIVDECRVRWQSGSPISHHEIIEEHPDLMPELAAELEKLSVQRSQQETVDLADANPSETDEPGSAELLSTGDGNSGTTVTFRNPAELPDTKQELPDSETPADSPSNEVQTTASAQPFGEYELLDVLGRGGMGVVYRARQVRLNRLVALKMILSGQFASDTDVQRFHAEAEAAAKLEHPGIVPIYEIGIYQGHHYFSMQYIEGESLAAKIRENPLDSQTAARYVEKIASAMAYAHQRGVLHRDLKPANVLIDTNDEPHVTDFGLAKRVDSESDMTLTGQVLGTPSYMPPEQALGWQDLIGPQADVYALGALLYALITGRPPFQAQNTAATLLQVIQTQPVEPRTLNPAIDRDVETICLKCLEKDPDKRYQGADALALELGRYLRGEPIQARPISRPQRLWRWCRRQPLVAGLSAAILLSMLVGTAVSTYFGIESSRNATSFRSERDRANQKAAEAEAALRETEATIDQYIETVENAELLREPRFQPLLKDLLQDALAHYKRYLERYDAGETDLDLEHQVKLARSLGKVGQLNHSRGSHTEALQAQQRALQLWQAVVDAEPDETDHRRELAVCYRRMGDVSRSLGDLTAGEVAFEKCLALTKELVAADPSAEHQMLLVDLLQQFGTMHGEVDDRNEQAKAYAEAVQICQSLAAEDPENWEIQHMLVGAHASVGHMYHDMGELPSAREAFDQALAVVEPLAAAHSHSLAYQSALRNQLANIGGVLNTEMRYESAIPYFERACEIQERLAREHPNLTYVQSAFAMGKHDLAVAYSQNRQPQQAREAHESALPLNQRLAWENPDVVLFQHKEAVNLYDLAIVLSKLGEREKSVARFAEALAIWRPLQVQYPQDITYCTQLGLATHRISRPLWALGRRAESLAAARESIVHWQNLTQLRKLSTQDKVDYVAILFELSMRIAKDNPDEGLQCLDEAAQQIGSVPLWQTNTDVMAFKLAVPAVRAHMQRLARLRDIHDLIESGKPEQGVLQLETMLANLSGNQLLIQYRAAREYAAAIAVVEKDLGKDLDKEQRQQLTASYAAKAIGLLQQLVKQEYFEKTEGQRHDLETNPLFAPLRQRTEYQEFATSLPALASATAPQNSPTEQPPGKDTPPAPDSNQDADKEKSANAAPSASELLASAEEAIFKRDWRAAAELHYQRLQLYDVAKFSRFSTRDPAIVFAVAEHQEGFELLRPRIWELLDQAPGHVNLHALGQQAALFPINDADHLQQARDAASRRQYRQPVSRAALQYRCGDYDAAASIFDHLNDSLDCRFVAAAIAARLNDPERAQAFYEDAVAHLEAAIAAATPEAPLCDWRTLAQTLVWRRETERTLGLPETPLRLTPADVNKPILPEDVPKP